MTIPSWRELRRNLYALKRAHDKNKRDDDLKNPGTHDMYEFEVIFSDAQESSGELSLNAGPIVKSEEWDKQTYSSSVSVSDNFPFFKDEKSFSHRKTC